MSNKVKTENLPKGWCLKPFGEAIKPTRPRIKPQENPDLPFIGMKHIEAHTMKLLGTVPAGTMKSSAVHFQPGDVLYGRLRPYLNKVYKPDFEGLCSAEFIVFPNSEDVDSKYLQYFLNSWEFVSFASHLNEGDRPRVDFKQLSPYPFPLPSQEKQKRIVAEIEKQFSRLDEAVANLKRVKANLKRYKAAVLKAAVEGKLTEEWRKQHPDVEPADKLLERILEERRANWKGRGKYKEPVAPDTTGLPELPEGWVWLEFQLVSDVVDPQPSHRTPVKMNGGIPYIGIGDINKEGKIDFIGARKVSPTVLEEHRDRYQLKDGDFIFGKIGTIGRPIYLTKPYDYTLSANVVLMQPQTSYLHPELAFLYMASPMLDKIIRAESRATTQAAFGIKKIRVIPFPLPPLLEQEEITKEAARNLSVLDFLNDEVDAGLRRSARLRQSILKKAFSGEL